MTIQNIQAEDMQNKLTFQKMWTDNMYNWDRRAIEWNGLLEHLLSRK